MTQEIRMEAGSVAFIGAGVAIAFIMTVLVVSSVSYDQGRWAEQAAIKRYAPQCVPSQETDR